MTEINGLILAGGRSSRMNQNKGAISYHEKPQYNYLFELLTPICKAIYTSCKASDKIPTELNPIPDRHDFDSPLNGILSAFQFDSTCAWLTVPVDMPWIDSFIITYLIKHRDPQKLATCFYDSTGSSPEPLLTIWENHASAKLLTFQKNGGESPREFLKQQEPKIITTPDPKYLTNINSPDELTAFRKSYMKIR